MCAAQLVTKLRMLSRDVGAVSYRMRGSIATVPVDIEFEDVFELNLLTGRVLKHTCVAAEHIKDAGSGVHQRLC